MKKNWYVVYTKSHCEIKVATLLTKKKIENYCPLNQLVSSHANKKRIIHEVLFPSFVFVHASEIEIPLIRQIGYVTDFVYWLGNPVIVKGDEIENIQLFTSHYRNIKLEKIHVATNVNVRIISDPYADNNHCAVSTTDSEHRISLPSLGFVLVTSGEESTEKEFNYGFQKKQMAS